MEPLPAGTLLHRRYRVVRLVGQGGMGAVYEAVDHLLENTVALKQMLCEGIDSDRAFAHEAKVLASLRHPSLPVVIDYFAETSGVFLVMQYVEGDDLSRFIQRERCRMQDVLAWASAVLDALIYLHGHHPPVVHRDIKPANLRRTPRGEIVLLDFGLAKSSRQSDTTRTAERSTFGYTPRYSPPEQIDDRGTDARSDLYSLGASLYHLAAGTAPSSATERLVALNRGDPDPIVPLHVLDSSIAKTFSDVISRALELRPDRRFASAAEMRDALQHGQSEKGQQRTPLATSAETSRRVDAAIPTHTQVGRQTDLIVQVRFASSPLLGIEDWPTRRTPADIEQRSEPIRLVYPVDASSGRLMPARVRIKVVAPDFVLSGTAEHLLAVPPDEYSKRLDFLLTPRRAGFCRVNVEVYDLEAVFLGSIAVESMAIGESVPAREWRIANLLLEVVARPAGQSDTELVARRAGRDTRATVETIAAPMTPTHGEFAVEGEPLAASEITHLDIRQPSARKSVESKLPRGWRLAASASTVAVVTAAVLLWPSAAPAPPTLPAAGSANTTSIPPSTTNGRQSEPHVEAAPALPPIGSAELDALSRRTLAAAPDEASRGLPAPSDSGTWRVLVFATSDEAVASYWAKKLTAQGFSALIVSPVQGTPERLFKVQVGRYDTQSDAQQVADRILRTQGLKCQVLR